MTLHIMLILNPATAIVGTDTKGVSAKRKINHMIDDLNNKHVNYETRDGTLHTFNRVTRHWPTASIPVICREARGGTRENNLSGSVQGLKNNGGGLELQM